MLPLGWSASGAVVGHVAAGRWRVSLAKPGYTRKYVDIVTSIAAFKDLVPGGMNIYFDNVGGDILDQCLARLAMHARVVVCGRISSGYGADTFSMPGPKNYLALILCSARMEGFLVLNYVARFPEATAQLMQWVKSGQIAYREDIAEGLENAPETLKRLFTGANFGKQLLKIADPPLPIT
jgi:NADPH-dependent curcumin reductase CurA